MTKPVVKPTEAQQRFVHNIPGANTNGLRRAKQIVANSRCFTYDGALAPTCIKCGMVRENRRLLKCDHCEKS
jgi:uncharacterized protein YjhX (UPF0386 family)